MPILPSLRQAEQGLAPPSSIGQGPTSTVRAKGAQRSFSSQDEGAHSQRGVGTSPLPPATGLCNHSPSATRGSMAGTRPASPAQLPLSWMQGLTEVGPIGGSARPGFPGTRKDVGGCPTLGHHTIFYNFRTTALVLPPRSNTVAAAPRGCHPRANAPRVLANKDDNAALAHTVPTTSVAITLLAGEWAGG